MIPCSPVYPLVVFLHCFFSSFFRAMAIAAGDGHGLKRAIYTISRFRRHLCRESKQTGRAYRKSSISMFIGTSGHDFASEKCLLQGVYCEFSQNITHSNSQDVFGHCARYLDFNIQYLISENGLKRWHCDTLLHMTKQCPVGLTCHIQRFVINNVLVLTCNLLLEWIMNVIFFQ